MTLPLDLLILPPFIISQGCPNICLGRGSPKAYRLKYSVAATLKSTYGADLNLSLYYVQIADYLNEMTKALSYITRPAFEHIDNNHTGLSRIQTEDLMSINGDVDIIYRRIIYMIVNSDFTDIDRVLDMRDEIFDRISDATKEELARITSGESDTKSGMLYLNILSETKTMVLQSRNLLKSQRLFMANEGRPTKSGITARFL